MCSYNRVNQTYACENDPLVNGILKGELGFKGFVVSDWFATHSGVSNHFSKTSFLVEQLSRVKVLWRTESQYPKLFWTLRKFYVPPNNALHIHQKSANFELSYR